jgi:hypothetical protein
MEAVRITNTVLRPIPAILTDGAYKNYYHSRIYTSLNDMNSQPSHLYQEL